MEDLILIVGFGAIGSIFSAQMKLAGKKEIGVYGKRSHFQTVREKGLRVIGQESYSFNPEDFLFPPFETEPEWILLTVKSFDTVAAVTYIRSSISKTCPILLMQNGFGQYSELKDNRLTTMGPIIRGVTYLGAYIETPGVVHHAGSGKTIIGAVEPSDRKVASNIFSSLKSELAIQISERIQEVVLEKTIVNCGINATGTIYNIRNDEILRKEEYFQRACDLSGEARRVFKCRYPNLANFAVVEFLTKTLKGTGENYNSTLNSILNHRRTEVDFLNGAVVKAAIELNIPVPLNDAVWRKIRDLENRPVNS